MGGRRRCQPLLRGCRYAHQAVARVEVAVEPWRQWARSSSRDVPILRLVPFTSESHSGRAISNPGRTGPGALPAIGQATGRQATMRNLAVGPPTIEQLAFEYSLGRDDTYSPPDLPIRLVSRLFENRGCSSTPSRGNPFEWQFAGVRDAGSCALWPPPRETAPGLVRRAARPGP